MSQFYAIGERFEESKIIYEVREVENRSCKGCACYIENENVCTDSGLNRFPLCGAFSRPDHKEVIFVQVGEAED